MRVRPILALVLLVLPAIAEAQRGVPRVRIGDRGPARPAPLPVVPGRVAREMRYVRLPYTIETYPLVSYFSAPGMERLGSVVSGGIGERLDLRLNRTLSLTLDITQSFLGAPAVTQTAELGVRLRPEVKDEQKWYPFFDVRGGAALIAERNVRPYDYIDPMASTYAESAFGFGGIVGTGVEYALHPRFTLTTAGSYMRSNMHPISMGTRSFDRTTATIVRYSIGFRYNPGRWTMPANLPRQVAQ